MDFRKLLGRMVREDASDLYLKAGSVPVLRIDGELVPVGGETLQEEDTDQLARRLMTERQRARFAEALEMDLAYHERDIGRFRVNAFQERGAVVLVLRKQSGTNAVEVGDRVKARLAELEKGFPEGYSVFLAIDNTTFTRTSIEHVQFDMIFGTFLAVLVVFLFLRNVRSTLIAALAIPTSVVGSFVFINVMGFTFNTLTMLGLSLSREVGRRVTPE